jgi:phosphate transport system substrate-binding protein
MMRSSTILRLAAPLLVLTTAAAACSSSSKSSSSSSAATSGTSASAAATTAAPAKVTGTLTGSGSTFQQPFDQVVIQAFQQANPGATVNYQGKGSGGGQTDLSNQVVDWAGSDAPIPAASLPSFKGGSVLNFPEVVAPIAMSYNLPGNPKINLDAATIAKIFLGKITNWNDPAIAADGNNGLPNLPITPVVRSDSSGTTQNFTTYLTKADPTDWTLGASKTIKWPSNPTEGNGNPGVANAIKAKSGAIGYVDFSDAEATNLTWAKVKNVAGNYIDATLAGASAAAADATVNPDLTFSPTNQSGAQDYPITSPTYIITYAKYSDAAKVALLKAFLEFVLGPTGQGMSNQQSLGFAPLPASLDQKALAQIDSITVG